MEVLSIELGRSIQLVVADEVRSKPGMSLPEVARLLTERYGFAVPPDITDAQKSGLKFREGRLISGNRMINIKELGIFNDGIIADTYDTSDSDFVIDDAVAWGRQTLGMREPTTVISRKYVSNIVAVLDERINDIQPIKRIADATAAILREAYNVDIPINLSGVGWASDAPASPNTVLSSDFSFYRRVGRPFSENRFFFAAPIPTKMHINWIEMLERELLRLSA
jgi:hypothetical protein